MRTFAATVRLTFAYILLMCSMTATVLADTRDHAKMSPLVRHAARKAVEQSNMLLSKAAAGGSSLAGSPRLTAFVRVTDAAGAAIIEQYGGEVLATFGDIYIASIPIDRIESLAAHDAVTRIEAGERCSLTNDTTAIIVNATAAQAGSEPLEQSYTGSGVIVGIQDIGFDLTHPTFYDTTLSQYRIRRFWDQLSADTIGSDMYVGAQYTTEDDILTYARSRDYALESHGTHTLGTAAGSGGGYAYRGIAYDSDICIVSNAVTSDTLFISSDDLYKYTSATDALGFKYIFDYADEVGMPCVISFSEGSHESFDDEESLYHAVLDSLVGPGRIIVAAAGNEGLAEGYIHKEAGTTSTGTFIRSYVPYLYTTMLADNPFTITFTVYGSGTTVAADISTADILAADSIYTDSLTFGSYDYYIEADAHAAAFDTTLTAYALYVEKIPGVTDGQTTSTDMGAGNPVSIKLTGDQADVMLFRRTGYFYENSLDTTFTKGQYGYTICSPGSAEAVICAGASGWRTQAVNWQGITIGADFGTQGLTASFSSTGPTADGRIKPDVVAPGTNIISARSSFFIEANAEDSTEMSYNTEFFDYNGRTYAWYNNNGTSMATPAVAAVIALWLEADPTLTPDDVIDIIANTSNERDTSLSYPNSTCGYGEIDAWQGLLYILGLTGIDRAVMQPTGQARSESTPGAASGVYTIDGRLWSGSDAVRQAPPGIYIVRRLTDQGIVTKKIAVTR